MANEVFSEQDHELLDAVASCLQASDISGEIQIIFNEIRCICQEIGLKARAEDSDMKYEIHLEIDHDTDPEEVRFYINTKLKKKFGQLIRALKQGDGTTRILILTKNGYRTTTPEKLNAHRKATTLPNKKITPYSLSAFRNIQDYLLKFRQILDPTS